MMCLDCLKSELKRCAKGRLKKAKEGDYQTALELDYIHQALDWAINDNCQDPKIGCVKDINDKKKIGR